MSVSTLLVSPPDPSLNVKVQTLDSVSDITTQQNVNSNLIQFNTQASDPIIPLAGKSKLYYNSTNNKLKYYNNNTAQWENIASTNDLPVGGQKCVLRLGVNPVSNPDPITNGLIVTAASTQSPNIFNVPLTGLPTGLGIGDNFIVDPAGYFTFNEADNTKIVCNVTGDFFIAGTFSILSNLLTPDNLCVFQVLLNGQSIFGNPPAISGGSNFFTLAGTPVAGVYNLGSFNSGSAAVHLTAGDIISVVFYLLYDTAVISLTSNLSISIISPNQGPTGPTGPQGPPGPSEITIYNGDGTLSAGRTLDGNNHDLTFDNLGDFFVNCNNNVILNSVNVELSQTPSTANTVDTILVRDGGDNLVKLRDVSSLPVPLLAQPFGQMTLTGGNTVGYSQLFPVNIQSANFELGTLGFTFTTNAASFSTTPMDMPFNNRIRNLVGSALYKVSCTISCKTDTPADQYYFYFHKNLGAILTNVFEINLSSTSYTTFTFESVILVNTNDYVGIMLRDETSNTSTLDFQNITISAQSMTISQTIV